MRASTTATSLLLALSTASAAELGYYTQPALHDDQIVFVSEGDLWSARVPAGDEPITAWRLTSGDGAESRPVFSPDGRALAFTGEYDGNTDVYVMEAGGGAPQRLTFHPGDDIALAWSADGRSVLFRSPRSQPLGRPELFRVSIAGGMPVRYPFGECTLVSLSPTGTQFAFTRWSNEHWTWKRYRGGTAPEIWVGDFSSGQFSQLTDDPANDLFPMWARGRVWFLSDRSGAPNIHSASPEGGDLRRHTSFASDHANPTAIESYDVRWPSIDAQRRPRAIVFVQGASLALLSLDDDTVRRLDVRIASDRVARRRRFGPAMSSATDFALSPDGSRLLLSARGELLNLPVEPGAAPAQLTRTSGARERAGRFLDAERVVLISDAPGEQQIAVVPADGAEGPSLATTDRQVWLFPPVASPDGYQVAFADATLRLHVLDLQTLERRQVDQSEQGEITDYRFSPDSRWLAYSKPMSGGRSDVYLYSLRTGRSFAVSDGMHSDREPCWDPAGRYLYMLSERRFDPLLGEIDVAHVFPRTTRIVAVPLESSTPPPVPALARAAGFDLEAWAGGAADETEEAGDEAGDVMFNEPAALQEQAEPAPMAIETDGIERRHHLLPIEAQRFSSLEAVRGGVLVLEHEMVGLLDEQWPSPPLGEPTAKLIRHSFADGSRDEIAASAAAYRLSADGSVVAWPEGDGFTLLTLADGERTQLDPSSAQVRVDVPAEWAHIFQEAWRLQRDFFWAENFGGVDWPAMRSRYEALLPRIGTREELNDLLGELSGELGTSHAYVWGGEPHDQATAVAVGMLGAEVGFDGSAWRIERVIPGRAWDDDHRSPLDARWLGVKAGDAIISINGAVAGPGGNIHDLLQGQAGSVVTLVVADDGAGRNSRRVEVEALEDERAIRYAEWIETNRARVAEASEGAIGYIHIPDMGGEGLSLFARQFYAQYDRPGLIIDVRDNGGGFVSQMILERLAREVIAFASPRHGAVVRYPHRAPHAHMVVLIDQHAGSDGDIFPAAFRMLELGTLIGTRTWGGVVGIRGDKPFVDMGLATQPEFAWWEEAGGWTIENEGVSPDIEVEITPADRVAGRDPQLDAAIEHLMGKLAAEPRTLPERPALPGR